MFVPKTAGLYNVEFIINDGTSDAEAVTKTFTVKSASITGMVTAVSVDVN
jgi:hypothetical protein